MHRALLAVALSVVAATPLASQAVIQTPTSTIEILGLNRWSPKMVEDSLAKYSQEPLTGHACAAILREHLHFADASVSSLVGFPEYNGKTFVAITVVEPQDSLKVRYKPAFTDSGVVRAEWTEVVAVVKNNSTLFQRALQTPSFFAARLSAPDRATFAALDPLHRLMQTSRTPEHFANARQTLEHDPNAYNRMLAAVLLGSFAQNDSAWWALMDAQRDPIARVASTASLMLGAMAKESRAVNWAPVINRVRYIVDGTNLFAFDRTTATLAATHVDPSLARALLGGGGTIVRAKLHSREASARQSIIALLSALSGLPTNSDAATFDAWLDKATAVR